MFSILYWTAPNVRQPGFRWLTPGGIVAVLVWIVASAAFAFYVANFSSYNKTYGALGGVHRQRRATPRGLRVAMS
jgi:membrane protein